MTTAFGTGVTGPDGRSLDQVQLTGVSARGYHGVLPSERQTGQEFRADVVLYLDTRPAAAGDDLAQTVSYADVAQDVHDVLAGEPADLVETVAERIAAAVLARPQVEAVDVRVHKPQAPIAVPFADVAVAIRRDRSRMPVVAAPASSADSAAAALLSGPDSAAAPADPLGYEAGTRDVFPASPPTDSWNDAAEHSRSGPEGASYAGEPEPQDLEPVTRPAPDEPAQFEPEPYQPYQQEPAEPAQLRAEAFEPDPLVERVPAAAPAAQPAVETPEPLPVPELIAPAPVQVVPAAWDLHADAPAPAEQRDQPGQEPTFRPDEQFLPEQAFEPVQQYESVQGLDQMRDQPNAFGQQYDQFAQQPEQAEQPGQRFEPAQQFEQQFEQGYEQQPQQPDAVQNQYDQLFEQQYDQGEPEATRVSAAAVPDPAVGQPEHYAAGQYQPEQPQAEQYQAEQYQTEPRDRFDEVPAGYVDVVIAIGANLGDPQATMRSAVAELDRMPGLQITDVSPLARTAAVGGPEEQPDYLNAVLLARTTLSARGLLHLCQEVENVHGRTREEHWGPRTLDVDVITYGNLTDSAEDLEVPHPRAHERAFVLEPWSQIAPDAVLPGLGGGPVAQLAATAPDRAGIRWLALDWLTDPEPDQGGGGTTGSNHPAVPDDAGSSGQDAHPGEMPPALPPSLPPSGRPPVLPGGPVVEVPGGGHPQGQHSGPVEVDRPAHGALQQEAYPGGSHPQGYSSGPVPDVGGSVPVSQQTTQPALTGPRGATPAGNGSAVPPPEEALVPAPQAPIAPRAVRDTAREAPAHEPLPSAPSPAKPVFAPVNPSRQQSGVFPPMNGAAPQEPPAPVFAPVTPPPNGVPDQAQNGQPNGHANGQPNGQQDAYDSDHTVIRVPGFVGDQRATAPSDGPIDSVPSWVPVRDERGRDA
ncbi:2-amino-4-hydroxy-6-hydroxymethyldihydropteridine diphosphokinase [Promicromonospora iranensis]|uniref:Bifunctional folate synthesis protein n=1 Tax=Promicromonospora iranensis TaxID=1105144 RepID=A0ABU2CQZ2_9MICO|nr:2-amino-4-hydroxy-6-hydroxymethyldihydropteridine diphosphokinase [Promicromonospora iranensis]MDR7383739.1 2-amino-4-hydroxy-6-hydroxymethyldihydropteridine diphosphokinase/dihydroneopterin aldolase [Promicromonospora iranensis]